MNENYYANDFTKIPITGDSRKEAERYKQYVYYSPPNLLLNSLTDTNDDITNNCHDIFALLAFFNFISDTYHTHCITTINEILTQGLKLKAQTINYEKIYKILAIMRNYNLIDFDDPEQSRYMQTKPICIYLSRILFCPKDHYTIIDLPTYKKIVDYNPKSLILYFAIKRMINTEDGSNKYNICFPSIKYLSKITNYCPSTVCNIIDDFIKLKIIYCYHYVIYQSKYQVDNKIPTKLNIYSSVLWKCPPDTIIEIAHDRYQDDFISIVDCEENKMIYPKNFKKNERSDN